MTIRDIVKDWLVTHKCDGLCNNDVECSCILDDLMPCGAPGMDCVAAREGEAPENADPDIDIWMYPIAEEADTDETPDSPERTG